MGLISHAVKVDDATWRAVDLSRRSALPRLRDGWDLKILQFDPLIFSQAYLLLGNSPARAKHDLTYYLSTIRAFFERNSTQDSLQLVDHVGD